MSDDVKDKPFDFHAAQSKDLELYEQWKKDPSKKNMGLLVDQLSGPIYKEVRRVSGSLPTEALSAEAKKWAIKGIRRFDPSKGAALSTHVTNYVMKTRRMNYQYQNTARLPENLQREFYPFSMAINDLETTLDREPTDSEVARKLGWSVAKVQKMKSSLFADHFESGADRATDAKEIDNDKIRLNYVMNNLTPEEKFLLTNVKSMSATDLASKIGVNINQLNYQKKKLTNKIKDLQDEIGYY